METLIEKNQCKSVVSPKSVAHCVTSVIYFLIYKALELPRLKSDVRNQKSKIKKASSVFFKSSVELFSLCNATKRILSRQNKYGQKKRDPSVIA